MTSLIADYEQQYSVLTAEITASIGILARSSPVEKRELIPKINTNIEEVQDLLVQIGLEIRDVPVANGQKATLTNRHQCYEAELKRLQLEFTNAKLADGGGGASLYGDSSDFDEFSNGPGGIRAEQQTRLLDNSERIERTGRRLEDGYRTVLETETIGATVLQDLAQQRETLQRSRARLRETNEDLRQSTRIMNSMMMRSIRERALLYGVGFLFVLIVSLSIYFAVSN